MWQPVMQVDRCGSKARAGVYARVPQPVRKGSCRVLGSVTRTAISLGVLVWWAQSKQPAHGHDSLARLL